MHVNLLFKKIAALIPCLLLTVALNAQTVTKAFRSVPLKTVLEEVERQTGYSILFENEDVDVSRPVTATFKDATLQTVLDTVLDKSLRYTVKGGGKLVTISRRSPVSAPTAPNGEMTVAGTVISSADNQPIVGANIYVEGTNVGTTTDAGGNYKLTVPASAKTVTVSFLGYDTKKISVRDIHLFKLITLADASNKLEDVVVVGFGVQKKESLVGAVQSVKPSDLQTSSSNLSTSFSGKIAGVIAVQKSGEPGADGANFWIRGISTFGSGQSPLLILDGVEITDQMLNNIPPETIESFSVLKDATATALYGSRGANGVMIVTTKNGKNLDKPVINFRFETALSTPTSRPETVDAVTYMQMYNESVLTRGTGQIPYTQAKIDGTRAGSNKYIYPDVDWYDEMFKNLAVNENFNFNIRGGSSRVDYFMSATVRHEEGMLKNLSRDYFSYNNNYSVWRYAFQNNVNVNLTKSTKVSLKINTQLRDTHGPVKSSENIFGMIMNGNPADMPITFPDDPTVNHIRWGGKAMVKNPVAEMVTGYKDEFQSVLNANLSLDQNFDFITEGLSASALISFKNYSYTQTSRSAGYNSYEISGTHTGDDGLEDYDLEIRGNEQSTTLATSSSTDGDRKIYIQGMINYNRSFGRHDVSAMVVYNQEETALGNPGSLFSSLPKRKQGLAGRLTYGYDNRYLIEANFGYNGSENFAEGRRFGFFPSVAVGYVVSQEKFWAPIKKAVSYFKLRGSYGLVGNDSEETRFMYMSDLSLSGAGYTTGADGEYTLSGPVYNRFENKKITWETGEKLNVGVDLQFYNRLNVMVDLFQEVRSGIFLERGTVPAFLGTATTKVYGNLGKVRNRGLDLSMDYTHQIGKDFFISAKGTFTFARNRVLEQDEPDYLQYPNLSRVGRSVNSFLLYEAQRLFIDNNEVKYSPEQLLGGEIMAGDIKYVNQPDANGNYDNTINSNDRIYAGYPEVPEIVYGFGFSAQWKGLDFSVFFQGTANTSLVMSGFHPFGINNNVKRNVMQFVADDYWSESNPNIYAAYPRLSVVEYGNNTVASTYWLRDASFLKLKNAEIGYTYKKMRFYISGSNLLTFSKFKLWDPEQGGGSGLKYPTQRVFNIGIQMTL